MTSVQKLVYSILEFLEDQKRVLDSESAESLEVATQCLEAAYSIDTSQTDQYRVPMKLVDIFNEAVGSMAEEEDFTFLNQPPVDVSPEAREEADKLKAQGNEFMKSERFEEALEAYSKAIQIDARNAVYYCNRAAAYSKLEQHRQALNDCDRALRIEPDYGKAYGRKGLAHSALNQHQEAIDCYTRALELDPDNQSYKNNLDVSKQKLAEAPPPTGAPGMGGFPSSFGGMDLGGLMNNPAFMNMAQSVMSNPGMQEMMSNMMGNMAGAGGMGGEGGQGPDMSAFLRVGQQFAQQVQQSNPELVEQIRQQTMGPNPGGNQPPPPPPDNQDGQS